jgi:uncharacterized SAM-binding protein YcdF (DUF218 family)
MFFTLSKIIDFLLLPISWIIALACITLISKNVKWKKCAGLSMLGILLISTNSLFVNALFSAYEMPQTEIKGHYPLAIILGGGMIRANQEDPTRMNAGESADRFLQPALLYKQGKVDRILITGGNTSIGNLKIDQSNETAQVKRLLVALGIPNEKILTETQAKNTHENAVNSKRMIDSLQLNGPILLVTSAFHMRRSMACFTKEGINCVPYVVDSKKKDTPMGVLECIIPSERELFKLSYLLREMFGFVIYRIMGYA